MANFVVICLFSSPLTFLPRSIVKMNEYNYYCGPPFIYNGR